MNKKVLEHALRTEEGPLWEIPVQFQGEEDLIAVAVIHDKLDFDDAPYDLQGDNPGIAFYGVQRGMIDAEDCPRLTPEFLKKALEDDDLHWHCLPEYLREDIEFARSVSGFTNDALPTEILNHFPDLSYEPTFWRRLFQEAEKHQFSLEAAFMMKKNLPDDLKNDSALMIETCRVSSTASSMIGSELLRSRSFLDAALPQQPLILCSIPDAIQEENTDLVVETISAMGRNGINDWRALLVSNALSPGLWMEFELAMAWVRSGFGFPGRLPNNMKRAWVSNRELCLAHVIAQGSFRHPIPWDYKEDVSFVLELVEHKPVLYQEATGAAKGDFKVMTTAFAGSAELAEDIMLELHFQGDDDAIENYRNYLRSHLEPYETFTSWILGNMLSTQSMEDTGTNLTLLNQGHETSSTYKRVLAQYLDIPTGKWLRNLQKAEQHVFLETAPWNSE